MFGENRLTDTCRAVFSKRAAPMSHDFFSCQGPRQAPTPHTRCGELRGGLSSRPPDAESLKHRKLPEAELLPRRQGEDYKSTETVNQDCKSG